MRCGEEAPRFVGEIQDRRGGSLGRARRLSRTVPRPPSVILQMIHQSMSRFSASSTCNPAAFGRAFWTADDECSREVDLWLQDSCTLANRLALGQIGSPAACTVHFACRSTSMACICSAWVFWGWLSTSTGSGSNSHLRAPTPSSLVARVHPWGPRQEAPGGRCPARHATRRVGLTSSPPLRIHIR